MSEPLNVGRLTGDQLFRNEKSSRLCLLSARLHRRLHRGNVALKLYDHHERHLCGVAVGRLVFVNCHDLDGRGLRRLVGNGEYSVNPHFAMCNKEINIVGSWDYSADDYPTCIAFLRQAREMKIPIEELITHSFPLDKLNEAMEVNVAQQGIKICYRAD